MNILKDQTAQGATALPGDLQIDHMKHCHSKDDLLLDFLTYQCTAQAMYLGAIMCRRLT